MACRCCGRTGVLAKSSFTKLPSGITMKGWKPVVRRTSVLKKRKQLRKFYAHYGMDVMRFDSECAPLQISNSSKPTLTMLIADFYATEFVMALLGTPQLDLPIDDICRLFGAKDTTSFTELVETTDIPQSSESGADMIRTLAWMRQVEIVEMLDEPMQNYFALVIGGELRWHPFISKKFFNGDTEMRRDEAWQSWLPWVKRQPPQIYSFFEQCFHDFYPEEPYGGKGWATAASVLRQRLMHEYNDDPFINKKLWLDRAFSCEHNNGCLMDKLYETDMVSFVLDAHHESDLIMLIDYASPLVKSLVLAMEQARLASA